MLLYIQITGKVIQKILKLFNLQRSVFTMLKKIVSGMLAAGMMLASVSAFACDCGSEYKKTYEYPYIGNDKHQVAYHCSNPNCDDPFTLVGHTIVHTSGLNMKTRIHGQFRGFKCVLFADILKTKTKIMATSGKCGFLIADKTITVLYTI